VSVGGRGQGGNIGGMVEKENRNKTVGRYGNCLDQSPDENDDDNDPYEERER